MTQLADSSLAHSTVVDEKLKIIYVIGTESERYMSLVPSRSTISDVLRTISVARKREFVSFSLDGSNLDTSDKIVSYFREDAIFSIDSKTETPREKIDSREEMFVKASRLRDGPLAGRADATDLFRQAASLGHVRAKGEYARCLIDGDGVKIDRSEKAYQIGAEAAEAGDPLGQAVCVLFCGEGFGCPKDESRAYRLAKASADTGNVYGIYVLGCCFLEGWGCPSDRLKAVEHYRQAAERNLPAALVSLGWCYENGTGVEQDEKEAIRLYRLAADQGDVEAQYEVGDCYEDGRGVEQDESEAVRLYRLAANQGHADAQTSLGWCFENSVGVSKSLTEALKYFRLAADQCDDLAITALKHLSNINDI
jgi:TPR repeat protein